ncbi:MAG: hypothetical protein IKX88_12380 [Thermoguttaceae bacterium]|nr:hypothetical protein [Thermoguttaceae bacterium]
MIAFWICMGVMAIGALAFWHSFKLWTVVLIGCNLLFATLFSVGVLEMLATIVDGLWAPISYYSEMDVFMLLFPIVFTILMLLTKKISKANIYLEPKTDTICKWIACFVVIFMFCGMAGNVFFIVMPEKPKEKMIRLPPMQLMDVWAAHSLSPLIGSDSFNSENFIQRQAKRNAAVYMQVTEKDDWKFDGDSSPNAQ